MALFPPRIPASVGRLVLSCAALSLASACAPRSCANPYVLAFLNQSDAQASIAHVGLLYAPVVTEPGPTPDTLACSVWEQVRPPGTKQVVLQPQYFRLRHVGDGWELSP